MKLLEHHLLAYNQMRDGRKAVSTCTECGKPTLATNLCHFHALQHRIRNRRYRKKKKTNAAVHHPPD